MDNSVEKGLGIAGLIVGIIALVVSFIPCFGIYAFLIGLLGLVLSGIAMYIAVKNGAEKGLIIAALIISALGTIIAISQYLSIADASQTGQDRQGRR